MKKRHTAPGKASSSGRRKTTIRAKEGKSAGHKIESAREPAARTQPSRTLAMQVFDPEPKAVYSIEMTARITGVPRRTILTYCKYHLLTPLADPLLWGYWFSGDTIRQVRRIESLRETCGDDLPGIGIILNLMSELEALRAQMRAVF